MNRFIPPLAAGMLLCLLCGGDANGWGYGGFHAGGVAVRGGGYQAGGWGGFHRAATVGGWGGARTTYGGSTTGWRGGSVNVAGTPSRDDG